MTIPQFVEALRSTPRDWRLAAGGSIRRGNPKVASERQCPIMAVAGPTWSMNSLSTEAGRHIGLENEDFYNILDAADNSTGGERNDKVKPLRKQLLEACGLKEE